MAVCIKSQIQNMNLVIGCTIGCSYYGWLSARKPDAERENPCQNRSKCET